MTDLPTYGDWQDVPDNLKTKTGLSKAGLKLAKGQQPVAVKTHWHYSKEAYDLYDINEAIPKRKVSKVQHAANLANLTKARTCQGCKVVQSSHLDLTTRSKLCSDCYHAHKTAKAHTSAVDWANTILEEDDALILDTETTGLNDERDDEIVSLGIINLNGGILFKSRFKPSLEVSPGAAAVTGLTNEVLQYEPLFSDKYDEIEQLLENHKVLAYNSNFDEGVFRTTIDIYNLPTPTWEIGRQGYKYYQGWDCVMHRFSSFYGEWWEFPYTFKWQSLKTACEYFGISTLGQHGAIKDCLMTMAVLKSMAKAK